MKTPFVLAKHPLPILLASLGFGILVNSLYESGYRDGANGFKQEFADRLYEASILIDESNKDKEQ